MDQNRPMIQVVSPSCHVIYLFYKHQWNTKALNFCCNLLCSHSNITLFVCKNNMLSSCAKISCFHVKTQLAVHWCSWPTLYVRVYIHILCCLDIYIEAKRGVLQSQLFILVLFWCWHFHKLQSVCFYAWAWCSLFCNTRTMCGTCQKSGFASVQELVIFSFVVELLFSWYLWLQCSLLFWAFFVVD